MNITTLHTLTRGTSFEIIKAEMGGMNLYLREVLNPRVSMYCPGLSRLIGTPASHGKGARTSVNNRLLRIRRGLHTCIRAS